MPASSPSEPGPAAPGTPSRLRWDRRLPAPWLPALLAAGLLLAFPTRPAAHEVPPEVTVHAFVAPDGDRLRLVVRAPLEAMRDVELPLREEGYLVIPEVGDELRHAARVWIADFVRLYEDGRDLGRGEVVAVRASRPADRSFGSYSEAVSLITGPSLPADTRLHWQQALMDVIVEYPIRADSARFAVDPAWAHLGVRTTTVLRFVPPGGETRVFQYEGNPGRVRLDPRWHQAALHFVELGFFHILVGLDHLLFLLCLVIPVRRIRPLVAIVTSFTVAHSITLGASALGLAPGGLWFPPLIETLIAASIVWMAFENIVGANLRHRWLMAFGFGLVHGFGFSFLLRESLQFAGSHLLTSLFAFNVGVELGQLLVVALTVPALVLLFSRVVAPRAGAILLSALVAHEAWHWMTERGSAFLQHEIPAPALDAAFLAEAMRWAILALIVGGAAWGLWEGVRRWVPEGDEEAMPGEGPAAAPAEG